MGCLVLLLELFPLSDYRFSPLPHPLAPSLWPLLLLLTLNLQTCGLASLPPILVSLPVLA